MTILDGSTNFEENVSNLIENYSSDNRTLLIIKPHAKGTYIDKYPLPVIIEGLVESLDLDYTVKKNAQLTSDEVWNLYPALHKPSEYGDGWKLEVVQHMSSEPLEVFLLLGEGAFEKGLFIKRFIRGKYLKELPNNAHNYLYNFVHTPEQDDFLTSFNLFFK